MLLVTAWPALGLTTFNIINCGTGPSQGTALLRLGSQGWQGMTGGSTVQNDCTLH